MQSGPGFFGPPCNLYAHGTSTLQRDGRTECDGQTTYGRPAEASPPSLSSRPLPSPLLRSRPPLLQLGGLGSALAPPAGPGERYLVNFRLKISPLVAKDSKKNFVAEKVVRPWPDRPDRRLYGLEIIGC